MRSSVSLGSALAALALGLAACSSDGTPGEGVDAGQEVSVDGADGQGLDGTVDPDADAGDDPDAEADSDSGVGGELPDTTETPDTDGPDGTDTTASLDTVTPPDAGPDIENNGFPGAEPMVKIISPSGVDRAAVVSGTLRVAGILFGDVDAMSWSILPGGQSGAIQRGAYWASGQITLEPGDNRVVVRAMKGEDFVEDSIIVTYNPGFRFDTPPRARPDVVWVGTKQQVVFTIAASLYSQFKPSTMTLLEVDADGNTLGSVKSMVDNGQTSTTGDEIQGDGVFTARTEIACSGAGTKYYRASVKIDNGLGTYDAYSEAVPVHCVEHLTGTECQNELAIILQADASAKAGASISDLVGSLQANPAVADAGRAADNGFSIWVQFKSGVLGAVLLAPPNTRGGGAGGPPDPPFDPPPAAPVVPQAVTGNVVDIRSKKAIVLAPFAAEFGTSEDGPTVASAIGLNECPSFSLTGGAALQGPAASLDRFRDISTHGIVSISTHGEALFGGLDPEKKRSLYAWNHSGAQEVIWSGEAIQCNQLLQTSQTCTVSNADPTGSCPAGTVCQVTQGSGGGSSSGVCLDRTQVDLRLGRVVLTNRGYAMTPAFFEAYAGLGYPNSVVNLGGCRTMYNGTLVSVLFGSGAMAITGFSGYVDSAWAKDRVVEMFQDSVGKGLLGDGHKTSQDPSHPGTWWRLFGASNLDLSNADIVNPSFEDGDTTGWTTDGDGRVVTRLGGTLPAGGKFMGLLSTGLGFTVQTGTLEQDFCIPPDKNEVEIRWKFYSEEFKEYCGSQFQDTFQAVLIGAAGQLTLVDVKVDNLCGYTDWPACGSCVNPESCDYECMGGSGCTFNGTTCEGSFSCKCGKFYSGLDQSDVSFDQAGVWTTQWQSTIKNVKPLAGAGKVTLRLFATDKGDSVFDTVILVDEIRFR
ncbi:MAG: choice-of-anchor L domain-containing protein [Deltaproteobacteria bacterium]|nr:choice-of-anchor L domain-containing protein [Deltaproteobacteria bacterium]MCB9788788.1 choice-of-anchor L domain-containing protein [Deltaproteobacteria bacterium]